MKTIDTLDTEYSDWQIDAHFFDKQSSSHYQWLKMGVI